MRKTAAALVCLGIIMGATAFAAERPQYEIDASYDKATSRLSASEKVTFVNETGTALTEVHFNVYANKTYLPDERKRLLFFQNYFKVNAFPYGLHESNFAVSSVTAGGVPLSYSFTGTYRTAMVVTLAQPLAPGASVTFDIAFALTLPNQYGLLAQYRDVHCFAHWYPVLSVFKG